MDAAHRVGGDFGESVVVHLLVCGDRHHRVARLVDDDKRYYMDYTGTGNSLNVGHPHSLQLIMDSLRYWVTEMHVDGFRFDLASALAAAARASSSWSDWTSTPRMSTCPTDASARRMSAYSSKGITGTR
ncbi:hypothetical protein IAE22_31000, partial [Bacillus sp. S34]|nr:hypothetical protein [Bacillus sp. S34]